MLGRYEPKAKTLIFLVQSPHGYQISSKIVQCFGVETCGRTLFPCIFFLFLVLFCLGNFVNLEYEQFFDVVNI
jgi:hypothetical protein